MIEDLVVRAIARDDEAVEVLAGLAGTDPDAVRPFLPRLLKANVTWRPVIFRAADDAVRDRLVVRIDAGAGARAHHLLQALAHAGGRIAELAFRRWSAEPPPDAGLLHLPPSGYPVFGGWCLTADGARRLCGETALDLVPAPGCAAPDGRSCPWCDSPLWTVLSLDTADPAVGAALAHTGWSGRLEVVTCPSCACHGAIFCEVGPAGQARWSPLTPEPEFLSLSRCEPPAVRLVPAGPRAVPYPLRSQQGTTGGGSWLGGLPDEPPGGGHPGCPRCGRTMPYVATADASEATEHSYGGARRRYAVFLDTACALAAVRLVGEPEPDSPPVFASAGRRRPAGEPTGRSGRPVMLPMPTMRPPSEA